MMDVSLNVPEVHCDHCKQSIEGAVRAIVGVGTVEVAIGDRKVDVSYDGQESTFAEIVQAIQGQGYNVTA